MVFLLLLGLGWFGIWILSESKLKIEVGDRDNVHNDIKSANIEDPFHSFGGKTPEATLKLLVSALEKSDLNLAAKYFVPEVRDLESQELSKLKEMGFITEMVKSLKSLDGGSFVGANRYYFESIDGTNQESIRIELIKNKDGLWKIISL